ncbi:hypothetical protein B0H17DRAFT_1130942 [Mycena rosella]|uniref:Uncharacterized protein n=1 Tax=Mycena rosella TaxID=1033263 RepID=A0AAD7DPD7_MYCRO|nr:hypothetical protein B0H17DRAFT_1130942 [Mycena rosella]
MPVVTSRCGLPLPLDNTFDYAAWRKQPADLAIPADMELQERNQHNYDAEMSNRTSIRMTRKYEEDVLAGNAPSTTRDVGAKLIAFYAYHDAEVEKMRDSQQYCDQVVAPLPPKLIAFLLGAREKCAKDMEKKKEDEKAEKEKVLSLKGTMVMTSTTKINPLTRPSVSMPEPFQAAIKYGLHPALFWFTDKRLRWATEHGSEIPMRKNMNVLAAPEKLLMDINKMKLSWGSDDSTDGHSILEWMNTSQNFLAALDNLCPAIDASNPFSFFLELTKHFAFFQALDDFEPLYDVWYPVEKTLHNKVLDNNLAFDTAYWSSEVGGVLNAFKAHRNLSKGLLVSQAIKMIDLVQRTHQAPASRGRLPACS